MGGMEWIYKHGEISHVNLVLEKIKDNFLKDPVNVWLSILGKFL